MTSYKGLLNKIEAFCNAHLQIKKYGGDFKEQMPNFSTENEKYPIVYVVPTSDLSDLNTNQFTLDVYCVDIIQKDRANINTIVSDCNLIVNDLYLYFLDGNDLSIDVIGASSGNPINNFDLDYSAGWVKSITFEVQAYSVCAIPMNPINPNPPVVCDPANYNLVDTLDNILSSGSIDSGATENIVVGNSTVENSDASYSTSVLAEGSLVLPDITVDVINSALTVVNTATVASVQDVTISAPDGTINIKKTGDGTISSQSVPSGATVDYSVADNNITVNSGNAFTIDATDPLDIVLTDGTSSVTPTSVTYSQGQHKVDIVLPATPTPTYKGTALPMKTGQETVFIAGDDGSTQYGRQISWYKLSQNNFFGHDRRFTGITGGYHNGTGYVNVSGGASTYSAQFPNNIIIDWDTYDEATGNFIMYYNVIAGNQTWNNARLSAIALSLGAFTSGWHMSNWNEFFNVRKMGEANGNNMFNYPPFSGNSSTGIGVGTHSIWLANTSSAITALRVYNYLYNAGELDPTAVGAKYFACRIGNISEL